MSYRTNYNGSLSQSLYRAEQVQNGEKQAAKQAGVSMRALMAAAGNAVFLQIQRELPEHARLALFCGEGNNGGDGYVIARLAQQAGYRVSVFALKPGAELTDVENNDAHHSRQAWRDANNSESDFADFNSDNFDAIVDAVFGVGLSRPLEGKVADWVDSVNQSALPVFAVDIPSGINADTGTVAGAAIKAQRTVTMIAKKRGMYTSDARHYCGEISLAELGVGPHFQQQQTADWFLAGATDYHSWLGERPINSHKGDYGHVLIVGGHPGMPGAVTLAMQAALRTGAGKVSVACHPANASVVSSAQAEGMVHGVESAQQLESLLQQATVVVLGPGLGTTDWSKELFDAVMHTSLPILIDADGLNLLAKENISSKQFILTPHPGEAARLLGKSSKEVEQDRFAAVEQLRKKYQGQVLLKGAGSLVASERGNFIIARGSPAMASGGMGDCLSGFIGALLAQRLSPEQALIAGTYWHAVAGEMAAKDGCRGTLASDLFEPLRRLVNGINVSECGNNGNNENL
ncbi:MAG: NAD(P)H-hydrate dehydratase [Pseudomonadota bacterium]